MPDGVLRRALHRLAASASELEAEDLQSRTMRVGAQPLGEALEVADRQHVVVNGVIRAITLRPVGGAPALEAELYDGTGSAVLVFLGRRRIPGLDAGRHVVARGRLCRAAGRAVIYNPRYEIVPADYVVS